MKTVKMNIFRAMAIFWLVSWLSSEDVQKYVEVPENCTQDRDTLLELYHRYAVPLPQRKYRLNRRGKEMTTRQNVLSRKRKITYNSESVIKKHAPPEDNSSPLPRFMTSANISSKKTETCEVPKSLINFDRKVIRLNSGKQKVSETKPASISFSQSVDSKATSQTVKLKLSTSRTPVSTLSAPSKVSPNSLTETVKLKSHSISSNSSEESTKPSSVSKHKMETESGDSPKKKIKRISWP